jgi:glycosyltransferase involved in cell wall biosynthesis
VSILTAYYSADEYLEDQMKILIIANSSGGLVMFRGMLIEQISKNSEVIALTPKSIRWEELENLCSKVIEIKMNRRGLNPIEDYRLLREYSKVLRQEKPDLVITYTIKPNIYGGIACSLNRVPYAANVTGLGTAFERKGILSSVAGKLYKIGLKKAKVVFFENRSDRDVFVQKGIIPESQSHVLNGAGVDVIKFSLQPYPANDIFQFLFIGRVMKEKGIEELLAVMKRFISEGKHVQLSILGRLEEDYKPEIDKAVSEGWLNYYGLQNDVRPYIGASDCFVLPSYHEGMANTNLECAASGRPVITSAIPGCMEAVIEGESGFLCKPKDVDSLYKVMEKIMTLTLEERTKMGLAGRKHMEEVFDKTKVVQETIASLLETKQ